MPEQSKRTKIVEETEVTMSDERARAAAPSTEPKEGLDERMLAALHAAAEKKALNLVALDLREVATFTDFFLIATGTNTRQVQAISDEVAEQLKKLGTRPARIEGHKSAEWVLLDYGDFIFHVFEDKARRFYDLERLWREAARVQLPAELAASTGDGGHEADSSLRIER
jgi:ribosome-associated protein